MSGSASDGRHSVSSDPSITSSRTLNSGYSGIHDDIGKGSSSSSPRPRLAGSRHNSGGGNGAPVVPSRDSGSPLGAESIEEQDFAHHSPRNRRSGGFLLDSMLPAGPRTRDHTRHSRHTEDAKGKRNSRHSHRPESSRHGGQVQQGLGTSVSSSPLSREVKMVDQGMSGDWNKVESTNLQGYNGELRLQKTRKSMREASPAVHDPYPTQNNEAPRPTIDPNQLVHMALNLSESRRRNLSAGQLIAPSSAGSRRVPSVGIQQEGGFRDNGAGSSLRQYLNEQRRVSRNMSPTGGKGSPSRHTSAAIPRSMSMSISGPQNPPSEATIARRDKARAYIELRMEYLRLLEYLPPLKRDAYAPGNFTITANNVPGSPHAYLTRVPSYAGKRHNLGRVYNPLQYLRNRRSRARERKSLDHPPSEFSDVDKVRDWVDRITEEVQSPTYRRDDAVNLPKYHEDHAEGPSPSKPTRPRMGWIFTPEELLADAHWLEQGDNKGMIEDRYGRKIFPPEEPQKQDLLQPRSSKEYPEKRRKSWVEALPRLSTEQATGDESEAGSERGRKRKLLPAFRSESPTKHKKHGWRGSGTRSGSHSDSSDLESDVEKRRAKDTRRGMDSAINTGPLGLHLKEMLAKEENEGKHESPIIISPDTPDKWGLGHARIDDSKEPRSSMESTDFANGSVRGRSPLAPKMAPKRRTDLTIFPEPGEPRSSFEDLDSTAPSTPLHPKPFPHIGTDLSPPPSRGSLGSVKKSKKSKLDIFRSDDSVKSHKHEPDSAGTDKKGNSRQPSGEDHEGTGLGTAILAAPSAVKSLLLHRKNDSVSSLNYPEHRKDHRDSLEPSSAVTRFFKGVKNEGSNVRDFIFRKDRPTEDSDSDSIASNKVLDESDTDEVEGKAGRKSRPDFKRTASAATAATATSKQTGKYHLDLPSFRSQNDAEKNYASDSNLPDPIAHQARARANSRPARFDRLAPPRMDLRTISSASSSSRDLTQVPSNVDVSNRMNRILASPGGVGQGGMPITPLANQRRSESRHRSTSRPNLDRHWSITDENPKASTSGALIHRTKTNIVTSADIARIRALFLCSGIKAAEIGRRAQTIRTQPPQFLTRAAKEANAVLIPIPRREEHVLAARILVKLLEAETSGLQTSVDEFRTNKVVQLHEKITALKSRVEVDLFPKVREGGDQAVAITSEVSASAPLTVKQVSDEIDKMIRMRRRRMRWVRRVGWMLVEWMLLGVMWWLWLVVVILSFIRRVFGFGWSVVRWLLWL